MNLKDILNLQKQLIQTFTDSERIALLDQLPAVQNLLQGSNFFRIFLQGLNPESECVMKQLAAIGQAIDPSVDCEEKWRDLLHISLAIDRFYREIGGIIGYQASILHLLKKESVDGHISDDSARFYSPPFDDISEPTKDVIDSIHSGFEALEFMAELYPLGGAADRLHLVDERTGHELPAAKLHFGGRALLETLIRDLQAREWLYYRLYNHQIVTPIAMMTSHEKDNHRHVLEICEECAWFGRGKETFRLFTQPLVPTVNEKGNWHTTSPLKPYLKPGGHGMIWKLARDAGVFNWLKSLGCRKALVRQINNPIAGLDYGLLAFIGIGWRRNLSFGFASCNRLIRAAEGMIVLKEQQDRMVLTNIEYCDFDKFGVEDAPLRPGEPYSRFSSNTNILFADLEAVEKAVCSNPFPGLLMNLKPAVIVDEKGSKKEVFLARLESTMQNIADGFEEEKPMNLPLHTKKTFVTYNQRHKTISVAKKAYIAGKSILETPEQCFYDLLHSNRELLTYCGFGIPPPISTEEYLSKGPDVLFLYHPALGPLYSVICQKLKGGKIGPQSEFIAEIAELAAVNLFVEGSLRIQARNLLGSKDANGIIRYSANVGRCILRDVYVRNQGVDWKASEPFWKMELQRKESLEIDLIGRSEFDAQGVIFEGSRKFVIEDGVRMVVRQNKGRIQVTTEKISENPLWKYSWDNGVQLYRNEQSDEKSSLCVKKLRFSLS